MKHVLRKPVIVEKLNKKKVFRRENVLCSLDNGNGLFAHI